VAIPQTAGYTSIAQTPVVHRREQRWFERTGERYIEEARNVRLATHADC
jgi:hypothetical protein